MAKPRIAGIILAGGKSSRMGKDKALLEYKGALLLDHMIKLLNDTNLDNIYISGDFKGYNCIVDRQKFNGPACAIIDVMAQLNDYDGALFVPVDMPLLTPNLLQLLLDHPSGAYFDSSPLPVFITKPVLGKNIKANCSVKQLLKEQKIEPITLPEKYKNQMQNFNTIEDWQKL